MLSMGVLALVFFLLAAIATFQIGEAGFQKVTWSLAALAAFGSIILLVTYFSGANVLFFENKLQLSDVLNKIDTWGFWNWVRTVFSLMATMLAIAGFLEEVGARNKPAHSG